MIKFEIVICWILALEVFGVQSLKQTYIAQVKEMLYQEDNPPNLYQVHFSQHVNLGSELKIGTRVICEPDDEESEDQCTGYSVEDYLELLQEKEDTEEEWQNALNRLQNYDELPNLIQVYLDTDLPTYQTLGEDVYVYVLSGILSNPGENIRQTFIRELNEQLMKTHPQTLRIDHFEDLMLGDYNVDYNVGSLVICRKNDKDNQCAGYTIQMYFSIFEKVERPELFRNALQHLQNQEVPSMYSPRSLTQFQSISNEGGVQVYRLAKKPGFKLRNAKLKSKNQYYI